MKKLAQALGFEGEVGLHQMVGRIELSAEHPREFAFLCALFNTFSPVRNHGSKITIEIDGKLMATYTQPKRK